MSCLNGHLRSQSRLEFPNVLRIKYCNILHSGQMAIQAAANENILGQRDSHHSLKTHGSKSIHPHSVPGNYVRNLTTTH